MMHQQALAAKTLPASLNSLLNDAITIVNYIRGNASNHRIFKAFCEEVGPSFPYFCITQKLDGCPKECVGKSGSNENGNLNDVVTTVEKIPCREVQQ